MKPRARLVSSLLLAVLSPGVAVAQSSLQHSGQAVTHSLQAIGEGMVAGAKLVSGVAAVPLKAAGAVGELSSDMGDALWEAANAPAAGPLPLTDDVITIGPPPGEAIRRQETSTW
ncbi:MAG TPA: mechanosensitive ion channel protein MscS [Gammaproteobacteria bacterium]